MKTGNYWLETPKLTAGQAQAKTFEAKQRIAEEEQRRREEYEARLLASANENREKNLENMLTRIADAANRGESAAEFHFLGALEMKYLAADLKALGYDVEEKPSSMKSIFGGDDISEYRAIYATW